VTWTTGNAGGIYGCAPCGSDLTGVSVCKTTSVSTANTAGAPITNVACLTGYVLLTNT